MKHLITLFLGLSILSCGSSKTTTSNAKNHILPESVFGEWLDPARDNEYNGLLIHPNFIEYGYTAFMYNKITKKGDQIYQFTAKDNSGQTIPFKLQVLNENTITLQRGGYPKTTFIKQKFPPTAQPVSMSDVPKDIKSPWYTTNGQNTLEFDITDNQFKYKGEAYNVDEIMHFVEPNFEQYRFVVSNDNKTWLFYFKNWNKNHVQIGYNNEKGAIYKSNKSFSEASNALPETIFGEWHNPSGNNEYDGVLIQPDFIEFMYTAYMFDSVDKINDTDYQFTARHNGRILTGTLSLLNENTINLQRGNNVNATFIKQTLPKDATPVSLTEVPTQIKGAWYPARGSNNVEFEITDSKFKFRGQDYKVDEIMHITDPKVEQYRFIVSKDQKTYMFYFKNRGNGFIQIGFDGMAGGVYQKNSI